VARGRGVYEEPADRRVRLDSLDPKTSLHLRAGANTSPRPIPAVLEVVLKVKRGLGEGYHWVECGACDTGWQVPHYAENVG
jgi:hypothetical protein